MRRLCSLLALLLLAIPSWVSAADPIGYVLSLSKTQHWKFGKTDDPKGPSSPLEAFQLLESSDRIFATSESKSTGEPSIEIRFFPAMCVSAKKCGPTEPCDKPIPVTKLFEQLKDSCRNTKDSWTDAIRSSFRALFQTESGNKLLLSMTLSRDVGNPSQESPTGSLKETVLTVDNGSVDLGSLFKTAPANNTRVSLQFCDPGPWLEEPCGQSQESERVPIVILAGKIAQAKLSRVAGIYRVRLWALTARGQQPTNQTAIVLIGPLASYEAAQRSFEDMYRHSTADGPADPILRAAMSAWLGQAAKSIAP